MIALENGEVLGDLGTDDLQVFKGGLLYHQDGNTKQSMCISQGFGLNILFGFHDSNYAIDSAPRH